MPHSKEQETYFADLIDKSVAKQAKSTRAIRGLNYAFSIGILFLSAILTVFLGLNFSNSMFVVHTKNIALTIGASITFLSGVKTFWKLETYWVRRKITLRRLEDLKDEFEFNRLSKDDYNLAELFQKYQSVQNYSTLYWEVFITRQLKQKVKRISNPSRNPVSPFY